MPRNFRTYRFISAAVATLLVFGVTAPVAHFVCAAAFGALPSNEAMHVPMSAPDESDRHAACVPQDTTAPPVSDTSCCLMAAAETDQATIPAIQHVPLLKGLTASVLPAEVAEPIIDRSPAPSSGPAFLPPGAPRQALLSVFLI